MALPSPANSPSLKPTDIPSRKRQRSLSMQSDTSSSSLKRVVSDPTPDGSVRSPRTDQLSTLSLADPSQDIDAYMVAQGEADIPDTIALPSPQSQHVMPPAARVPFVESIKSMDMKIGETWYLVSRDWWKRWRKACTGEVDKEGGVEEKDLGPVDNSRLLDQYGNLEPSLAEGVDVEYVPVDVWERFVAWYGEPKNPLPRRVIARGAAKLVSLELRPPRIKVLRLSKDQCDATAEPSHPWLTISAGETVSTLCIKLAETLSPNTSNTPYRIWKLESGFDDWTHAEYPTFDLTGAGAKIIEESSKTLEEEGVQSDDAFVVEFKTADGWLAEAPKADSSISTAITPYNHTPAPLFNSKEGFFNKMGSSTSFKSANKFYNGFTGAKSSSSSLLNNRNNMRSLEPGTLGLGNMGNTCFMNSALQCLAHTKELTEYFLNGVYKDELNPDNPLGMGGAIAKAFGDLLEQIWASSGSSTSYSPREFKSQLQRFAPQFSGYQQHDSQELVAFLLDGLHEDLNRVLKKPYVEKPDWEGGGDLELVKLAKESWDGYMKRNDSVIVDLFQGQYQSTLVCPECEKVSITFDPFMYLTLPLPVHKKWKHTIYYVPWDNDKPHVKVLVEINREASFRDLRNLLGRWMGVPPDNLITMEIFSHRFYKNLDDNLPCGEMGDNDVIVCFELPCHARQSRTYKKQEDDPFIVPIFLCDAKPTPRNTYLARNSPTLFGYPTIVVINQKQAKSVDAIYDAVINRLERWTDHARDLYAWEASAGSSIDDVPIHLNTFPPIESISEINADGELVVVQGPALEEGDIVDEKSMSVDGDDMDMIPPASAAPRIKGTKKDLFDLRLQVNHKELGTAYSHYSTNSKWETWESREEQGDSKPLLHEDDALYCEFDENMKAYYFGEPLKFEHARWDTWEDFIHPEYKESQKNASEKKNNGISLQDCLDEFTKEEKLGEDDLWYCPQCKKHQQATKRFDLWKAPDVLVVHLKRFSNSRMLRDKIDAFIDFPVEGLDIGSMIGERAAAERLLEQGVDIEELNLGNMNEPLVYDLFGVDEHMGGLGGGHYRSYASNHLTGKWYHFDDSFVTPAKASDAVNSNAYLLFYRRRASTALGGKTHEKIEEARLKPKSESNTDVPVTIHTQLPTPPNEPNTEYSVYHSSPLTQLTLDNFYRSGTSNGSSSIPSPLDEPPDFEDSLSDQIVTDPLEVSTQTFDFPDTSSNKASPSSSTEAEFDDDFNVDVNVNEVSSPSWNSERMVASPTYSPISSNTSDLNPADPFSDANVQKDTDMNIHDKTA